MVDLLSDPQIWASLFTLTMLEIVLGIDNIIFISIVAAKLPQEQQRTARLVGLTGAFVMRIGLLFGIVWLTGLTATVFEVFGNELSWRDIILIGGGVFLLWKSTVEIHEVIEGAANRASRSGTASLGIVIFQIMLLDLVFSVDSIITAIGLTQHLPVMITAIAIAIVVMMFSARYVGPFIEKHPSTRMLALSFLLLIGMALIADGLDFHIPRGYLYFAIGFSMLVEALNLVRSRRAEKAAATLPGQP